MHAFDELEHEHHAIEQVIALLADVSGHASTERAFAFGAFAVEFLRRFADGCHHAKEEQALFPLLEARGVPRAGGPLGQLLLEHEEGRALVHGMERALSERNLPAFVASAGAYAGLLRAHIAKERHVLFPLAERRLDADDERALGERFAAIEREVGGEALHARFDAELEAWKQRLGTLAPAAPPPHAVAPVPRG
jgi:hemerythrin-like domain-containing protein